MKKLSPSTGQSAKPAASFQSLRRSLRTARTPQTRHRAALAVIHAYAQHYSLQEATQHVEQLQEALIGIRPLPQLTGQGRIEVMEFCTFTRLLIEAINLLDGLQNAGIGK